MVRHSIIAQYISRKRALLLAFFFACFNGVQAQNVLTSCLAAYTDTLFANDSLYLHFDPQTGIPIPPSHYTTRQAKAGFIARNWWKNTSPNEFYSYAHKQKREVGEQKVVDFLSFLPLCDSLSQQHALYSLLDFAASDSSKAAYNWTNDLLEKYLWDEESPMYNEELYAFVLRYRTLNPKEEEGSKVRAAMLLPKVLENRIGKPANDLLLSLPDGSETSLHKLLASNPKDLALLIFYDLDCIVCQELIAEIARTPALAQLQIITIQLHNQNIPAWKSYIAQLPSGWINTYDTKEAVFMEETFYMRNSSALYLADKNGIIRLKNTHLPALQEYLSAQSAAASHPTDLQ